MYEVTFYGLNSWELKEWTNIVWLGLLEEEVPTPNRIVSFSSPLFRKTREQYYPFFLMKKSVYQSLHPWPPNNAFTHATIEILGRLVHSFLLNGSDTTPICTEEPVAEWKVTTSASVKLILHTIEKCKTPYSEIHAIFSVPVDVASAFRLCEICEIQLMHALVAYSIVFLIVHSPYWHESWNVRTKMGCGLVMMDTVWTYPTFRKFLSFFKYK